MDERVTGSGEQPRAGQFGILVVCTANICRSPMAEYLLRGSLKNLDASSAVRFRVESAGTYGWDGAAMDPPAATELRRLGGDPNDFRARTFAAPMAEAADLVLAATADHRRVVLESAPTALHRTFTLFEFAHLVSKVAPVADVAGDPAEVVRRAAAYRGAARLEAYDLPDPYGQPVAVHQKTAEVVLAECVSIAAVLQGRQGPST